MKKNSRLKGYLRRKLAKKNLKYLHKIGLDVNPDLKRKRLTKVDLLEIVKRMDAMVIRPIQCYEFRFYRRKKKTPIRKLKIIK